MPNTNPTIVSASLSDKELQDSINKMVANFDKGLQTMLEHSNEYVGKIQESLQKIGNTNFGAKGSNDGAVVKQTKAQNDFTDAVKRSTNEIKRQGKETAMSFDQIAAAQQKAIQTQGDSTLKKSFNRQELQQYIDRLRELQAEYIKVNTQEGAGAKSDKIKADMRNLEELIAKYREILRNLDYVNSRQGTIDVKKWVQDLGAVDDRYKKLTRWYTVLEKEDQRRIASEEKANQKRLADLEKEKAAQDKVIKSYQDSVLKAEFGKVMKMPTTNIDEIRAKFERLSTIIANIRELGILSPEKISAADSEVKKLGASIQRYEKFEQERIAAEQKFVIEQAKEVEQTQTLEGRVKGLAQAAREYMKANSDNRWSSSAYGKDLTIYAEGDVRARGLSIEEQIRRQLEAEQQVIQQQVSTAQQLNNERKKYVSPTTATYTAPTTDMLRKFIASKAGVDVKDVKIFDETTASASKLQSALKQVHTAYSNMSAEERNSPFGQALIRRFQELQREAQKTQRQLSRPVSLKDALGGSEKTLDDIAYKMQRLSSYRSGLNIETQKNEIDQVNKKYAELQTKMNEVMQKNQQMIASNTALGRSWNYMKNRLAFYFTVGASTQFVKNLIEVRSQYEMNERALGILVDSAERGTQIFRELSDMALVSPYTLIELSSAAKQLTAYDVAAKDVVDTTRRLADMASAVGVPVERLTYALGQIKAYGYLNSRDARMFANAGIPLVKELADHYTRLEGKLVSTADVYDRIKKKAIDYNDVMQVMNEMTDEGGRFYDFQAKMADTLKVQLANLTLAWNNMLNDLGNSQQGVLTGGISALKELFLHWQDINRLLTNVAITLGTAKAAQLLLNLALGKGTIETIRKIGSLEGVTAAQYKDVVATANLTKAQAKFLVAINRNNVALRAAIVQTGILTAKEAEAATTSKLWGVNLGVVTRSFKVLGLTGVAALQGLWAGVKSVSAALWSIATNPLFIAMTAIMAVVDAMMYYNQISEKTAQMNKAIADNAKEASDALGSYLKDTVNIGNRAKAIQGVLSVSEGQKAWDSLREQIELSSDAAGVFIAKLLEEEDINKRVKEGFDVAESIREATNAMAGLNAEALKVSQDSWLWGAFGEGLAEDLEDYIEEVQKGRKNGANIGSRYFAAGERKEAMDELTAFANDAETIIRDRLGAGVKDAVQLKEAVERVKKEVIAANPQIKGEVKKWFDVEIDRMMAERFGGVYNELSSIQSQFIEHIKHDSGAALRRLSDDILDTSKELDDDVLGAISKAWNKLKDELPAESQDLISKLQKQMDENPLTLRVLLLQAGEQQIRDAIQKDYEQHFYDSVVGEKPQRPKDVGTLWDYDGDYKAFAAAQEKHEKEMVVYNQKNAEWEAKRAEQVAKYGDYNKKKDESRKDWAKRVNDSIKAAKEEQTAAQHTIDSLEKELSLEERKTDVRYQQAVADRDAAKVKIKNAEDAYNYEKLYQEEKGKGRKGSKKDPLLDALKQEISLVEKLQSDYDKLSKSGASQADALDTIRGAYGKTIRLLNTQLQSYGLPQIDISQLITGKDPNKALAHFKQTLDTLVSKGMLTLERSKELEAVVEKFTLSAKTYNLDMITKGLNNELGKLKDEYELAVELDANPEMGNLFADFMGINVDELPRTFQEAARRAQKGIDKVFAENNRTDKIDIASMLDKESFDKWVKDSGLAIDSELVKAVEQFRQYLHKTQVDENKKMTDGWSKLVEKYGDMQAKMLKIYKDSVQEQIGIVRKFGDSGEVQDALDLSKKINLSQDPAEIARLQEQLANIIKSIVARNPQALGIATAIENKGKSETAKATWEDFKDSKDSELYTMTFEDMANNSTRAIQLIMDKLEGLKDKVKEDPASMKALIKSLEDAENELVSRDPFGGIARSVKAWAEASDEAKVAQKELWEAEVDVEQAQQKVKDAEDSSPEEQKAAQEALAQAVQKRANAQVKLTQAENKGKKAQENLKNSLQGITNQLGDVKSLFDTVSSLFRAGGDDETADAIDAISEGFTIMTTVIMGVVAAMVILQSTVPWLLAMAAALSVVVGLVSFLSGNSDKKIVEQIEESERAVKRLELAYIDLDHAVQQAYGMATIGANMAAKANKELQLVELKRQLALERSRDSKHRDEDKIIDLQKQIKELEYDIADTVDNIVNDLLGISSVGDAMENMMDAFIEALRSGEDAMATFDENVDEMIANMVKKMYVTKILQPWFEEQWDKIQEQINQRAGDIPEKIAKMQSKTSIAKSADTTDNNSLVEALRALGMSDEQIHLLNWYNEFGQYDRGEGRNARLKAAYEKMLKEAEQKEAELQKELTAATMPTMDDIRQYAELVRSGRPILSDNMKEIENFLRELGLMKDDASKNLSALQAGISGITEDTAGALEAYMNGVSQQVYLHSDLLTQIRDAVVGFDIDVQTASLSQILLQLQTNYIVMQSMQSMMEGWTTPSGQGIRVELIS